MKKSAFVLLSMLLLALIITPNQELQAQTASQYIFSASTRTYAPITGGTVISSTTTHDDQYFNNQNIGFTFNYLGTNYTQLGVSINGYVVMGTAGGNTLTPISIQNLAVSAMGTDLQAQANAVLRIQTIGTAPNRICVIQWLGYKHKAVAGNYNFQIRLHETSNKIEFHYGAITHGNNNQTAQVGINGALVSDYNNRRLTTAVLWNTTNTTLGTSNAHNLLLRSTAYPTNGLVYAYFPPRTDLALALSVSDNGPCIGDLISHTLTVNSNGPANTTGVSVSSANPAGLTFVSATPSQGSFTSGTGVWNVGDINDGGAATLTIYSRVNVGQGGNTISRNGAVSATMTDPQLTNNTASVALTVRNNSLPTITAIDDVSVGYNGVSSPIAFTIGDAETPVANLIVNVISSNVTCIPLSGIAINGTGANRNIVITPGLNQFGNSIITVLVSDGVCEVSTTFNVEVFKQTYSNFESARIVVGQVDFNTVDLVSTQIVAPGSNSSAVSAKGVLAVGSQTQNRVLIWNSVPTTNGAPANIVVGQTNFTNVNPATSALRLRAPDGVAFSPDGNKLIIADAGNHRILIYNTIPTTSYAAADVVVGQADMVSGTAGTTANRFNRPTDVLVTPDGKMIVTDRNNHRVLIFNRIPTTNGASADIVIGQTNLTTVTAGNTQNKLRSPWNCSLAPDGKLLIADDGNNRVLVFNSIPTTNGANANVVIGQTNFTNNTSGATRSTFNGPGVTVSPTGVVAVADFSNHRVLVFNQIPTTNGADADIVLGQDTFTRNVAFNNGAGAAGTASDRNMSQPYGINFDLNERLFLNGRNMHRLMIFGQTPDQVSDLAINFNSSNGNPCVGGVVSYTINVVNNGPTNATNVIVTSALPYGYSPIRANASFGTYNMNSGFWTIPLIENGQTVSLEMIGSINTGENLNSITAYASVRSYNQADNNFANNSGSVTVTVEDNESPVISAIDDVITDFNTSTGAIEFTISDAETANPANLLVTATSSNTSIVPNANIVLGGAGGNRTITVTPANNQSGTVDITIRVADGRCETLLTFKVSAGNVWLGYTNDWTLASNWSVTVPDNSISAYIPASPIGGVFPIINSDVEVLNLGISNGASLTINASRVLSVYGNFYNDGTASTGNGTIRMMGSSAQTIRGNVSSVILNNPNGATLNGNLNFQGTLTLTSGSLTVGANTLTLRNPIAGNTNNLITTASSSITIAGNTAGISLPTQTTALAALTVNNGSGLTLNSNLSLGTSLTLTNGLLRLNGHSLTINGTIARTTGNIAASPSSNITINGTGVAGTIGFSATDNLVNNFIMNRTASGSINLANDVRIGGTLSLIAGKIFTGTNKILVENTNPASIANHNTTSYIVGNMKRCVVAPNSYDFPLGSAANYELATVSFLSISASTCIDATFTPGISGTNISGLSEGGKAVDGILNYGFWTIKPDNAASVINYNVRLTSRGHTNGGPSADHHTVIKRDNPASNWVLPGNFSEIGNAGAYYDPISVSRMNITGFSDFAVGVSSEGSLPVELLFFKAENKNGMVNLNWQTASETNNEYFEVEKGYKPSELRAISKIAGQGTTRSRTNYIYNDTEMNPGDIYYRLKQVDFDGNFSYSKIVKVSVEVLLEEVKIFPNPIAGGQFLKIQIPSNVNKDITLELRDIRGNKIQYWTSTLFDLNRSELQIPNVSPGTYILIIQSENQRIDKRIVIR